MSRPRQGAPQVKTPKTRELETQSKIKRIRARLEEIAEYKKVLAVDGSKPDVDDKRLESELIVRLLYLEKELKQMAPEALALKARMREEEAARTAQAEAKTTLKRRGGSDQRPQRNPRPAPFGEASVRPSPDRDAKAKKPQPRSEPWRSPYGAKSTDGQRPAAAKPGRAPTARPSSAPAKRPSPYAARPSSAPAKRPAAAKPGRAPTARPSSVPPKRPSPYASRPDQKKASPSADQRRPPRKPGGPSKASVDGEQAAGSSTNKKKGYWSREDRRVRPAKSGRAPAPRR